MSHYGNYRPEWANNMQIKNKAHFKRFKAFFKKVEQDTGLGGNRFKAAVFMALLGAILLFSLNGCKTQHTVIKEETVTRYIDSTIWHTDTTYYQLPIEVYSDYTGLLDTLRLENTYSYTWSAVDTNKMILVGELRTKDVKIPVKYLWKDHIIYQDSIVEKPVPYPVVEEVKYVPWYAKISIVWTMLTILLLGLWAYMKFWKH